MLIKCPLPIDRGVHRKTAFATTALDTNAYLDVNAHQIENSQGAGHNLIAIYQPPDHSCHFVQPLDILDIDGKPCHHTNYTVPHTKRNVQPPDILPFDIHLCLIWVCVYNSLVMIKVTGMTLWLKDLKTGKPSSNFQ